MTIKDLLKQAEEKLKKTINTSYQLDSEILMSKVLKKKREFILLNLDKEPGIEKSNLYKDLIHQRPT